MRKPLVLWGVLFVCLVNTAVASDWPMAGRDATRSGRTDDSAPPPYRVRWAKAWQYENIATVSQLIVAQGRGFIGTLGRDGSLGGKVHAVDVADGRDLWTYGDLKGGIAHSLAWSPHAGGTVYSATTVGEVVAIEAATGQPRWKFETPLGGFVVSPCVFDGVVLVGSRQGVFYAIREEDGKPRWQRDVGVPICNSAAAADGVVYFLDDGMNTHALKIADGTPAEGWIPRQLHGGAARFYWPVIAGEHVLFTVAPPHQYNWPQTDGVLFKVPGVTSRKSDHFVVGTPAQETAEQANVIAFLKENPHSQVMHCLSRKDGRPACVPGVFYTGGSGSECAPPVVTKDGKILVEYRSFYSLWDSDSWVNPYSALGQLDPATGVVTQLRPQLMNKRLAWGQVWIIADESSSFTLAGETLLVSHQGNFGGFDLATKKTFAGVGKRDTWGGYPALSWNRQEWHGTARSPLTVVDGTVYYVVGGRVTACEGNAKSGKNAEPVVVPAEKERRGQGPGARGQSEEKYPTAEDVLAAIKAEDEEAKKPVDAARSKELREALQKHASEFIANEQNAPFHEWRGISRSGLSMEPPEDTVRALSLAYPHLNGPTKERVKKYLEPVVARLWTIQPPDLRAVGQTRNYHRVDRSDFTRESTVDLYHRGTPGGAYALSLYVRNLGEREFARQNWRSVDMVSLVDRDVPTLESSLGKLRETETIRRLACQSRDLSSLVGYLRLEQELNLPGDRDLTMKMLVARLKTYLQWHRHVGRECAKNIDAVPGGPQHPSAGGQFRNLGGPYVGATHQAAMVYWTDMCPEIGRILRTFAPEETAAIRAWMLRNAQGFYLVRWDTPVQEGEVTAPWYNTTMNYFHLVSTVAEADATTQRAMVDMPACHADVYYLERLAWAIEGSGR